MTLTGDLSSSDIDVQLYCRAQTSTAAAVDRYHDGLARLRSMGVVDGIDVTTWPSRVDLQGGVDDEAARAYEEFSTWADGEDVALKPAFNVREYESEFTGERGRALITPVGCLAVYSDGDLAAVYPHVDGDEVRTVEDGLEDLEAAGSDGLAVGPSSVSGEPAE